MPSGFFFSHLRLSRAGKPSLRPRRTTLSLPQRWLLQLFFFMSLPSPVLAVNKSPERSLFIIEGRKYLLFSLFAWLSNTSSGSFLLLSVQPLIGNVLLISSSSIPLFRGVRTVIHKSFSRRHGSTIVALALPLPHRTSLFQAHREPPNEPTFFPLTNLSATVKRGVLDRSLLPPFLYNAVGIGTLFKFFPTTVRPRSSPLARSDAACIFF